MDIPEKNNLQLVVLTDNVYLHAGIAALLPGVYCRRATFCAPRDMLYGAEQYSRLVVIVDSMIFFRGEWRAFDALLSCGNDVSVIWLSREETGRLFPFWRKDDFVLSQKKEVNSLRSELKAIAETPGGRGEKSVTPVSLTHVERRLLPYFLAGIGMAKISVLSGCKVKTLYTHRQNILKKTGFRQLSFLQFAYSKIRSQR